MISSSLKITEYQLAYRDLNFFIFCHKQCEFMLTESKAGSNKSFATIYLKIPLSGNGRFTQGKWGVVRAANNITCLITSLLPIIVIFGHIHFLPHKFNVIYKSTLTGVEFTVTNIQLFSHKGTQLFYGIWDTYHLVFQLCKN